VVIPAPKTDYLEEDIKKVSDFLNNDGNLGKQLLYIASYGQEDTPNLDEFLSEYGLSVGKGVICESDSGKYYNSPCVTVASDVSDNFTQDVSTENPAILSSTLPSCKTHSLTSRIWCLQTTYLKVLRFCLYRKC